MLAELLIFLGIKSIAKDIDNCIMAIAEEIEEEMDEEIEEN